MTHRISSSRVCIDGQEARFGSLEIGQDFVDTTSLTATKPNMAWYERDTAGHFHAYAADGALPTLATATIHGPRCNGNCEELDYESQCGVRHPYVCRICGAEVQPARISDPGPHMLPGRKWWRLEVFGMDLLAMKFGQEVSVTIEAEDTLRVWGFGIARVGPSDITSNGGTVQSRTLLYGKGEFGQR